MKTEFTKAYIVLPFKRIGMTVGARHALVFDEPDAAHSYAEALSQRAAGVAILERTIDQDGHEEDRLVTSGSAVPAFTPGALHWTMRLH